MKKITTETTKYGFRRRVQTINTEPTLTDESQAKDCDANIVMAQWLKTGQNPHMAKAQGYYLDISEQPTDLLAMRNQIEDADEAFYSLPAETRDYFKNDPNLVLEFLKHENNREKAVELGLLPKSSLKQTAPNLDSGGTKRKRGSPSPSPSPTPSPSLSPKPSNNDDLNDDE